MDSYEGLDQKREATVKHQFVYHIPSDHYFACLFGPLISSLKKAYPDSMHLIVPQYGIRFYETYESRYPAALKKIEINYRFTMKQIREPYRLRKILSKYLDEDIIDTVEIASAWRWLWRYYLAIVSRRAKKIKLEKYDRLDYIKSRSLNGINIGDLCANTFMRYKTSAKLELSDEFLSLVEAGAKAHIDYWTTTLNNNSQSYYFGSYGVYTHGGIGMRVAAKKQTGIINFGAMEIYYRHYKPGSLTHGFQPTHLADYANYRRDMSNEMTQGLLSKAEHTLEQRTNNNHQDTMPYMRASLRGQTVEVHLRKESIANSIVLMLHDFYDSPHLYRHILFPDFITWAEETIEFCINKNIDLNIKPHPNEIEESAKAVDSLKEKYKDSQVNWICKQTPNSQIFQAKPSLVITAYGSVVAEAAYKEISVLLCGDHPGINFNIGFNPRNKKEYFEYIKNNENTYPERKEEAILFTATHCQNIYLKNADSLATHENVLLSYGINPNEYQAPNIQAYTSEMADLITKEVREGLKL